MILLLPREQLIWTSYYTANAMHSYTRYSRYINEYRIAGWHIENPYPPCLHSPRMYHDWVSEAHSNSGTCVCVFGTYVVKDSRKYENILLLVYCNNRARSPIVEGKNEAKRPRERYPAVVRRKLAACLRKKQPRLLHYMHQYHRQYNTSLTFRAPFVPVRE